jgi:GH15 family glucan-1,4-alpha-glucosidase
MPVGKQCRAGHGWLIREIECVRGKTYFEVECEPAFNYARDPHEVQIVTHGARFKSEKLSMVLTSSKKRTWTVTPRNGVLTKLRLVEGQKATFIFRESKTASAYPNEDPTVHDVTGHPASQELTEHLKTSTIEYWRNWIAKCTYTGRWREAVYRSALVLKLLTFEPTGAIVAAATTSLPEGIGGTRNWDYRFSWIRDSSFVLYAFIKLGFREEAAAFMGWIAKRSVEQLSRATHFLARFYPLISFPAFSFPSFRCEESSKGDGSLQIMYGLHGEHKLEELELDHLSGYMDSKPVRIGNGAYDQVQLDIYGELLDTVYLSNKYAEPISYEFWQHVRKMVDWICIHWTDSDEGIWEVRGGQQHFVYSKVMSWVALDRGIRLAERRSFPADLPRWYNIRNTIYEEIQEKGWNPRRQAFVQHYGSETLDASVLIMPLVFFMSPTDPRFVSTLDAILASTADGQLN